jgi:hypothetical protein
LFFCRKYVLVILFFCKKVAKENNQPLNQVVQVYDPEEYQLESANDELYTIKTKGIIERMREYFFPPMDKEKTYQEIKEGVESVILVIKNKIEEGQNKCSVILQLLDKGFDSGARGGVRFHIYGGVTAGSDFPITDRVIARRPKLGYKYVMQAFRELARENNMCINTIENTRKGVLVLFSFDKNIRPDNLQFISS